MTMNTTIVSAAQEPSYTPPCYSRAAGREALAAIAPALDHIDGTATVRVDVQIATYTALGVVGFVISPGVRERFAELPARAFDIADLDGLEPACFAMLYTLAEARAAGALEDGARLPAPLAAEAAEVEARMQSVCEYQLADDPEIKPELDRLRPGVGYRDLANDLMGYARIYELRPDAVKADKKHYREGDAARAEELAGMIMQTFSAMSPKARAAYDLYVRVWTLLSLRYDEVRGTGLWLFRKDPRAEQRFPSLFTAGRPNVGRPKKIAPKDAEVENGGDGGGDSDGDGGVEATPS
jgi:hypothetical protein